MLKNISWMFNRLRAMENKEIAYRVRQAVMIRAERMGHGLVPVPPAAAPQASGQPWVGKLPMEFNRALYRQAADRILDGRFDVFSLHDLPLGFPPRWNRDPKTGREAPLAHGKSLDYRDQNMVGDIKYLWEPNRHLQITTLAQAYHLTGDMRYAEGVRVLLESWFEQCPYPRGPNWTSSLELGIRLINWSVCWHLLGGERSPLFRSPQGQAFRRRWLGSIYQHCHFIAGYLSRWSSANNHLFGELTGLFMACLTWPIWKESAGWRELAHEELEREAIKQTFQDGVNREQAIYYHHEVADMMLHSLLAARANGAPLSKEFVSLFERMLEFIAAVMDVTGSVPLIGDGDDALLVRWTPAPDWCPYRSLLATGAVLFQRPDFKFKAGLFDDKSRWLLGDAAAAEFAALESRPPCTLTLQRKFAFPEGGYFIMGDRLDTPDEVRMLIDAGQLGYLSIAAHGHADALSFTLSVKGRELLIDPGTFAYHTNKKWRDYFRGTSAHNTVRIDDKDQSEPGGNFIWLRKANVRCELWESGSQRDRFMGSHDGYTRLPDPVVHRRKIAFHKDTQQIVVEDILECQGMHQVEFCWHLSDQCEVEVNNRTLRAANAGVTLEMTMPGTLTSPDLLIGCEERPFGWISRRFDHKVPSPSAVWKERIFGTTRRTTVIRLGEVARPQESVKDQTGEARRNVVPATEWTVACAPDLQFAAKR